MAAAAAFLHRATSLTLDAARRAERALAAAQAEIQAGALDAAAKLLAVAEAAPLSDLQHAHADLFRAQLAFVTNRGSDAPPLLLKAATRFGTTEVGLSRATYLDALSAAIFAGRLANPGGNVLDIACAAAVAPPAPVPQARDLLLDGTAIAYTDGYAAGLPLLRQALAVFGVGMSAEEELRLLWMATTTALRVWDDDRWDALSTRHVELAYATGALSELPLALTSRAYMLLFAGDLNAATSLADQIRVVTEATGSNLVSYGALGVAAFRGDIAAMDALLEATTEDLNRRGEGVGITFAEWANALLNNGLGRYPEAVAAARRATAYETDPGSLIWPLVELIEAAVRNGTPETAADAYRRLAEMTTASGYRLGAGLQARSQALLSDGDSSRAALPRGNHPPRADPAPSRSRPCPPPLRRMAPPGASARRRTRGTAYSSRHAGRDGNDGTSPTGPTANCEPPAERLASAPRLLPMSS